MNCLWGEEAKTTLNVVRSQVEPAGVGEACAAAAAEPSEYGNHHAISFGAA